MTIPQSQVLTKLTHRASMSGETVLNLQIVLCAVLAANSPGQQQKEELLTVSCSSRGSFCCTLQITEKQHRISINLTGHINMRPEEGEPTWCFKHCIPTSFIPIKDQFTHSVSGGRLKVFIYPRWLMCSQRQC